MAGSQQTGGATRVVDPVLSTVAQGWRHPMHVWHHLFPPIPVDVRGGKIVKFNRESFRRYNTVRGPGANTQRIQYGYSGEPFALTQHALEGVVPFEFMEDASVVPGIDLGRGAVEDTRDNVSLEIEHLAAEQALADASYANTHKVTLAGNSQWSHAESNPFTQINKAKNVIRRSTGMYPNVCIIGSEVFQSGVENNKAILDRTKHTSKDSITVEMLQGLFRIDTVREGMSIYLEEDDADDAEFKDVWGKNVVIAYVAPQSLASRGSPSYGYTYQLRGYPRAETPYEDRRAKSWVYPVTDECTPVVAGQSAAYLIKSAVA